MSPIDISAEMSRKTSEEDEEYEYIAPDGDWAWFVLGGSVIVNLFICGLLKCHGVLFVEISDVFDTTPVMASWILSLSNCLFLTLGPLSNYLSKKLGFRICTIVGVLFAVSGLILSSLATCVEDLYVSLGILYGVGAGLLFPLGVIMVSAYFVRRRGFAMGVSFSGGPLGSFFLPPFIRILAVTYGFRGAVLILGGLTLHVLLAAIVYVPVKRHLVKVHVRRSNPSQPKTPVREEGKDNPVIRRREEHENEVSSNGRPSEEKSPASGRSVFKGSVQGNQCTTELKASTRRFHISGVLTENEQTIKKENKYALLFRDPVFYIIIVSSASTATAYNFAMFLPAFAQSLGFNKDKGSYLLSIIAVFDLVGRIGGGTISDWFLLQKKYYFMFGVFFSGVFMTAVSVSSLYSHITVLCAFFGLTSGIFVGTQGVMMAEVLGEDKLAHTFTLAQFVKGVVNFISPPLCGFFYERMGSYRPVFQCFGLCHIIGATIWFLIPCVRKK